MQRRQRKSPVGCLVVIAGIIIILALILPAGFWWFALAIGLIVFGIYLICNC